jgi:quercetin dioxygenase-like cupin family protein
MSVLPRHFRPGEGKTYTLGRITLTFKTGADDNADACTLCEAMEPPGSGAGLHRHTTYDETHLICEGHYEFQLGEKLLELGPGDTVWVPRGTAHSIKCVGPETGRELLISSPGGVFDRFIAEVAISMTESGSPSLSGPAMDFREIAVKYGIEFLG